MYGLVKDIVKKTGSLRIQCSGKSLSIRDDRDFWNGGSSLRGMREGFLEEVLAIEEFKLGNEHKICKTY